MLGIETHVLVRFWVRDDEAQYEKACGLIKKAPGRLRYTIYCAPAATNSSCAA